MSGNVKSCQEGEFSTYEYIVYPAHGIGKIKSIEKQAVAGQELELFVIHFEKNKMDIKVPVKKALSSGMRKLSNKTEVSEALRIIASPARGKKIIWSRRAQLYDLKLNSGSLLDVAEVTRDLYRADKQFEQSYSERQLYELAFDRLVHEVALVYQSSYEEISQLIEQHLSDKNTVVN